MTDEWHRKPVTVVLEPSLPRRLWNRAVDVISPWRWRILLALVVALGVLLGFEIASAA